MTETAPDPASPKPATSSRVRRGLCVSALIWASGSAAVGCAATHVTVHRLTDNVYPRVVERAVEIETVASIPEHVRKIAVLECEGNVWAGDSHITACFAKAAAAEGGTHFQVVSKDEHHTSVWVPGRQTVTYTNVPAVTSLAPTACCATPAPFTTPTVSVPTVSTTPGYLSSASWIEAVADVYRPVKLPARATAYSAPSRDALLVYEGGTWRASLHCASEPRAALLSGPEFVRLDMPQSACQESVPRTAAKLEAGVATWHVNETSNKTERAVTLTLECTCDTFFGRALPTALKSPRRAP